MKNIINQALDLKKAVEQKESAIVNNAHTALNHLMMFHDEGQKSVYVNEAIEDIKNILIELDRKDLAKIHDDWAGYTS